MPEAGEQPAKPLRTWRPMAMWTAGMLLALGLVWFVAAVGVPLARARLRVRTLLNSPTSIGRFSSTVRGDPFSNALADLAESQGRKLEDYSGFDTGRAVKLGAGRRAYVMVILGCTPAGVPGTSMQQLVLMDPNGRLLDKVSCDINSRYGLVVTEVREPPDSDGARAVFAFKPGQYNSHWHNWHTICHGTMAVTFREEETKTASVWDQKGLCRIGIERDRFVIIWPEMSDAASH